MQNITKPPVSTAWQAKITNKLKDIESEQNIQILLAVESGSRAWGFHSPDSDYDVRFIYVRPIDWHLSLHKKRDVVEYPINSELDLSGWELSKALNLALGSNAVVAEWLQSPIIYQEDAAFRKELTTFCKHALDGKSVTWHYLSLFKRQKTRSSDENNQIKLKRYFYMLRPILALRWIRLNEQAVPPMNMQDLMNGSHLNQNQSDALETLIEHKKNLREAETVATTDKVLDSLIETEQALAERWLQSISKQKKHSHLRDRASLIHIKYTREISC